MILLWHRGGPKPCLGPALSVLSMPSRHEIAAENVVKLDGTKPLRGEGMLCGTCGEPLHPQWLYKQVEPEVMV